MKRRGACAIEARRVRYPYYMSEMIAMRTLLLMVLIGIPTALAAQKVPAISLPAVDDRLAVDVSAIGNIRELADGRVLIGDLRESKLLVGDFRTGKTAAIGRKGAGPLEFGSVRHLFSLPGDSTFMLDAENGRRWLVLHHAKIVGTISADRTPFGLMYPDLLGTDRTGNILATLMRGGLQESYRPVGDSVLLLLTSLQGKVDTIGKLRTSLPPTAMTDGAFIAVPQTADDQGRFAIHVGIGDAAAIFPDGWVAIARGNPYRVDWRSPSARVQIGRPLVAKAEPFGKADQKAYLRRQALFFGHEPKAIDSVYGWPAAKPAMMMWGSLTATAGSDGKLYLLRMPSGKDSGIRYDVIDRDGSLATLTLPPNRYLIGFGTQSMYLVAVDDDGLMTLERYRWPGGPRNR